MKRFRKLIVASALMAGVGFSSCESVLNILPPLDLANEAALTNTRGLRTALTGTFSPSGGLADGSGVSGNVLTSGELWSDQVQAQNPGFGQLQIVNRNLNFFNDQGRPIWQNGYGIINRANNILDAIPTITDAQIASEKNLIRGNALFLRAWAYFNLVRSFAQPWGFTADNTHLGVILRLTPTRGSTGASKARSTVAEVYAQIIKDLIEAESLLPEASALPDFYNSFASKGAVAGLLARVYFQQNDFTNAAAAASRVISNSGYSLSDDVMDVFKNSPTPETIFQLISDDQSNSAGAVNGNFRQDDNDPPLFVDPAFATVIAALPDADKRKVFVNERDGVTRTTKYDKLQMNVPLIRLPEMLLIRAEATAQSAAASALADLNQIRRRAGLAPLTGLSGQALIDAIRRERSIELCFEGDRFHELKRTKQNIRASAWNASSCIFKIPDVEVNANTLCQQNPD